MANTSDAADVLDTLTGKKPPTSYAGFSQALSTAEAAKEKDTAPIVSDVTKTYKADKDKAEAAYQKAMDTTPDVTTAPKPPPNDPWQAWTSPAMLFGLIAAGLTKTPMVAATKAATAAIEGKRQGDMEAYQQAVQQWKENTDLAYKRHDLMMADYRAASEKLQSDLTAGHTAYLTTAAKWDDQVGILKAQAGLLHDMDSINIERSRLAEQMKARADALKQHADELVQREKDRQQQLKLEQERLTSDEKNRADALKLHHDENVQREQDRASDREREVAGKTIIATDPVTKQQYTYNPITKQATTLEGKPFTPSGMEKLGAEKPQAKSALSPGALDRAAEVYHRTRQLPPGFQGRADRDAVMNREQELWPGDKGAVNLIEASATEHAGQMSLNNLTKITDAAESYEDSAKKEFDLAVSLIPEHAEPLNSQLLTRWVRSGETQFGDVAVPKYQTALIGALDKYAKILSGATGAAGSTDAARAQAFAIFPQGATSDQIPGIVEILKRGMDYTIQSSRDKIQSITKRLAGDESPAKPPPGKEGQIKYDAQGNKAIYKNGRWVDESGNPL